MIHSIISSRNTPAKTIHAHQGSENGTWTKTWVIWAACFERTANRHLRHSGDEQTSGSAPGYLRTLPATSNTLVKNALLVRKAMTKLGTTGKRSHSLHFASCVESNSDPVPAQSSYPMPIQSFPSPTPPLQVVQSISTPAQSSSSFPVHSTSQSPAARLTQIQLPSPTRSNPKSCHSPPTPVSNPSPVKCELRKILTIFHLLLAA